MIIGWRRLSTMSAIAAVVVAYGCDSGAPSKTRDDIAADSALASDLALANRDTLLVDSIGEYRPPDAAESDTTKAENLMSSAPQPVLTVPAPVKPNVGAAPAPAPPVKKTEPVAPPVTVSPPPQPKPVAPVTTTPDPSPSVATGPTRKGAAACSSPLQADQEECVRATLPAADMRLNRIYRALITEIRRQEGVRNGGGDPTSVERLRVSQRSWLVYRDNQCRKRGRGKEGALWARPRVRCLGQFSIRRANELADNFSRITAH